MSYVEKMVPPAARRNKVNGGVMQIHLTRQCDKSCFNCLDISTEFITRDGVKSFRDFKDGESITVLTHKGNWKDAIVRCYGNSSIDRIKIVRGKTQSVVYATPNHRWIDQNGKIVESLARGVRLATPPLPSSDWDFDSCSELEKRYWCYGFVYGDGTLSRKGTKNAVSQVVLCGHKIKYATRFKELGFTLSQSPSIGDNVLCYLGKEYLKTLPPVDTSLNLLSAFIQGWLSADGEIQKSPGNLNKFKSLQVTGEDSIDFVKKVFPMVGVYITSEKDHTHNPTNYGRRSARTVRFGLMSNTGNSANCHYVVSSIYHEKPREVWCLEVDDDQSFVLPNGVVTGNCTQGSNLQGPYQFMSPILFEEALVSLKGYPFTIGIFGGNPAIHPQFETICEILRNYFPIQQCGIWCNHPLGKAKTMAKTFNPSRSNLNCHLDEKAKQEFKRDWPKSNPFGVNDDSRHSPVFVSMLDIEELKDNRESREDLISNCDINKFWSASIGMFRSELRGWFCEIAMAQSIINEGMENYPDTGLDVTKDYNGKKWWELPMTDFADQVEFHCHRCGVPLRGYGTLAQADDNDGVEYTSEFYRDVYFPKRKTRKVEYVQSLEDLQSKDLKFTEYVQGGKK